MRRASDKKRRSSKKKRNDDDASRRSSVDDLQSVIEGQMQKYHSKPEYREIKMGEMMKLYDPMWMAWIGMFASFIHAFSLPMFGFALS